MPPRATEPSARLERGTGLTLSVRSDDGGTVISVSGDVDICTKTSLVETLLRAMREHGPALLLDLSGVSFMDCGGLRAISAAQRRAQSRGGSMRLIAASEAVRRIARLAGVRDAFEPRIHGPGEAAFRAPAGPG